MEAKAEGYKRVYEEGKVSVKSENYDGGKELMMKLKAKDVELEILKNEREDIHKIKEELLEAKRQVITYNIIPSLNVSWDVLKII